MGCKSPPVRWSMRFGAPTHERAHQAPDLSLARAQVHRNLGRLALHTLSAAVDTMSGHTPSDGRQLCTHLHKCEHCICEWGIRSLGRLYNVNMGKGLVRLSTTKDCPVHDSCRRYTKEVRAARPSWSNPYCPKHKTRDCPETVA
jgi:hypothetical protein